MIFNETYSNLANSFNSWCEASPTGGEYVSDLAIEYANRAQDSLVTETPHGWDYLTKWSAMTLGGSSGLEASMPADFGMMLQVYADTDSDGKPDYYYYKDGRLLEGFRFINSFTKSAGHSFKIQFYQAPLSPLYLMYQVALTDFTGSGTEYLFFPKNIMLRKMQHLRCLDKGLLNEWDKLSVDYKIELDKFKSQHQNNAESIEIQVNDARGREITVPRYNLHSGSRFGGKVVGKTNDQDIYRR